MQDRRGPGIISLGGCPGVTWHLSALPTGWDKHLQWLIPGSCHGYHWVTIWIMEDCHGNCSYCHPSVWHSPHPSIHPVSLELGSGVGVGVGLVAMRTEGNSSHDLIFRNPVNFAPAPGSSDCSALFPPPQIFPNQRVSKGLPANCACHCLHPCCSFVWFFSSPSALPTSLPSSSYPFRPPGSTVLERLQTPH